MTVKTLSIDPTKPADGVPSDKSVVRAHWSEIKTKYETLAGQALRYRGTWASGTFLSGDVVKSDGAWYYAAADSTTEVPGTSTNWVPMFVVPKTAAQWAASAYILPTNVFGVTTDTGVLKIGNGVDTFANLTVAIEGGSDHDAVTLSSSLSGTISTPGRDLISSDTMSGLSAQVLTLNRFRFVDASSGTVDIPLAASLTVGDQIDLKVTNADNAITVERPEVAVEGTGTTNGTTTVTMADTSMVRVGDVVSSATITSSQTVDAITEDTSITLNAVADGSGTDETITFTGKRGVFNGTEADVTLRKGLVVIKVTGTTTGIDADILGATNEGLGPLTRATESADFTLASSHLGKRVRLTKSSGTQTVTVPKPSAIGADPGVMVIFKATLAGATTFTLSGTGSPVFVDIATNTLNITPGGSATLIAVDDDTWDLDGAMVAS